MKFQEIRVIAKNKGVKSARVGKSDLIRAIQRAEGNIDCFGFSENKDCDQQNCLWMEDCLSK